MLNRCISLALLGALLALAKTRDPNELLEKAKAAMQPQGDVDRAIRLLREADVLWERSDPGQVAHAQALDLLALFLRDKLFVNASGHGKQASDIDIGPWQSEAAPITKRALDIYDAHPDANPADVAFALELHADALGRETAGAPFWQRATQLRARHIEEMQLTPMPVGNSVAASSTPPMGRGFTEPSLVFKTEPEYTELARLAHYSGTALLTLIVDVNGVPQHIELVHGLGYGLDERAVSTVRTWRFSPATKDGRPVAVRAQIQVNFVLL